MNAQEVRCKKHSQKSKSRLSQCMEFLHHRKIRTEKQKSGRQIKSSQEFFCTKYFFQLKDFPKIKSAKSKVQWRTQCNRILQKTVSGKKRSKCTCSQILSLQLDKEKMQKS